MVKRLNFILLISISIILYSCNNAPRATRTDTPTSGLAEIVVDECFAPIIQQQIDVFEGTNRDATIIPTYTSELEAFNLFMQDSIRLIIATRELTKNEKEIVETRNQTIRSQRLAIDGLALIVHKSNKDTLLSVSDLRKLMTGEKRSWKDLNPDSKLDKISIVFDSPNSSTVRFIKDSICRNKPLGDHLRAVASDTFQTVDLSDLTPNQRVIDFVSKNPNALGLIGVSWVSNPTDSTALSFINNINVMSVSHEDVATAKNSIKPYAAFLSPQWIKADRYPLNRDVFIIISDIRGGLPSGFVSFSAGEKGQRIIYRSGLFPGAVPTNMVPARQIQVKTSF